MKGVWHLCERTTTFTYFSVHSFFVLPDFYSFHLHPSVIRVALLLLDDWTFEITSSVKALPQYVCVITFHSASTAENDGNILQNS